MQSIQQANQKRSQSNIFKAQSIMMAISKNKKIVTSKMLMALRSECREAFPTWNTLALDIWHRMIASFEDDDLSVVEFRLRGATMWRIQDDSKYLRNIQKWM